MEEEKTMDNESFLLRVKKEPELLELDEIEDFLDTLDDLPLEFDEANYRRRGNSDSDYSVVEISTDDDDDDDDYEEQDVNIAKETHDETVTANTSRKDDADSSKSDKDCNDKAIYVNKPAVCNNVKSVNINEECDSSHNNKTDLSSNTFDDKSEKTTANRKDEKRDVDNKTKRASESKTGDEKVCKSKSDHIKVDKSKSNYKKIDKSVKKNSDKQKDSKSKIVKNDEDERPKRTENIDKNRRRSKNTKAINNNPKRSDNESVKTAVNKTEIINKVPSELERQRLPENYNNENIACSYLTEISASKVITDKPENSTGCNEIKNSEITTAAQLPVKMNCKVSRDPRLRRMNEKLQTNSIELTSNHSATVTNIVPADNRLPREIGNDLNTVVPPEAVCTSQFLYHTMPYGMPLNNVYMNYGEHVNTTSLTESVYPGRNEQNMEIVNDSNSIDVNKDNINNVSSNPEVWDNPTIKLIDTNNESASTKHPDFMSMEISVENTNQFENPEPVNSPLIDTVLTDSGDFINISDLRRKSKKSGPEEGECTDSDSDSKYAKYETKDCTNSDQVLWTRRRNNTLSPKRDVVPAESKTTETLQPPTVETTSSSSKLNDVLSITKTMHESQPKLVETSAEIQTENINDQVDYKKAIMEEVKKQMKSLQLINSIKENCLKRTVPPLLLNTNDICVDSSTKINNCTALPISPIEIDNLFKNADEIKKGSKQSDVNRDVKVCQSKDSIKHEIEKCKDVDNNIEKSIRILKQKGEFLDKKLSIMLADTKVNQEHKIKLYMNKKIENLKKIQNQVAKQIGNKNFEQRRQEHYVNIHEETVKNFKADDTVSSKHVTYNCNQEPDHNYQVKFRRIKHFEIDSKQIPSSYEERLKVHEEKVRLIIALNRNVNDTNENDDKLLCNDIESEINESLSTNKHEDEIWDKNKLNNDINCLELQKSLIKSTLEEISGRNLLNDDNMIKSKIDESLMPVSGCFNSDSSKLDHDVNTVSGCSDMSIDNGDNDDELFPTLSSIMKNESHETTEELIKELIQPTVTTPERVPKVSETIPIPPSPPVIGSFKMASVVVKENKSNRTDDKVSLRAQLLDDLKRRRNMSTESLLSTDSSQSISQYKHRTKIYGDSDIENKWSSTKEKWYRRSNSPYKSRESKKRLKSPDLIKRKELKEELYSKKKKLLKLISSNKKNKKYDYLLEKIIKCEEKLKKQEKKISKKKRKREASSPSSKEIRNMKYIQKRDKEYRVSKSRSRTRSRSRSPFQQRKSLLLKYGRNPSPDKQSEKSFMRELLKSENELAVKRLKEITDSKEEFNKKAAVTELLDDFSAAPIVRRTRWESRPIGKAGEDQTDIRKHLTPLPSPKKCPSVIPPLPNSPPPPTVDTQSTGPSQSTILSPSIQSIQKDTALRISQIPLPPINSNSCLNSAAESQTCKIPIPRDTKLNEPSSATVTARITCQVSPLQLTISEHTGVDVLKERNWYKQTNPPGNCSPIISSEDSCMSCPSPIINCKTINEQIETEANTSQTQMSSNNRILNASISDSLRPAISEKATVLPPPLSPSPTNLPPTPMSPSPTLIANTNVFDDKDKAVMAYQNSFVPVQHQYSTNPPSAGNMMLDRVFGRNPDVINSTVQPPVYNSHNCSILGDYTHPQPYKIVYHPRFPYPITVPIRNPIRPHVFQPIQHFPRQIAQLSSLPQPINKIFHDLSPSKVTKRSRRGKRSKKRQQIPDAINNDDMDSSESGSEPSEMQSVPPDEDDFDSLPGIERKLPNEDLLGEKCSFGRKEIVPVISSMIKIEDDRCQHVLSSSQCIVKEEKSDFDDNLSDVEIKELESRDRFKYLVIKHNPKLFKYKKLSLTKPVYIKLIKYFDNHKLTFDHINNSKCSFKDRIDELKGNINNIIIDEDLKYRTSFTKHDGSNEDIPIVTNRQTKVTKSTSDCEKSTDNICIKSEKSEVVNIKTVDTIDNTICSDVREEGITNGTTLKQNFGVMKDNDFPNEKCTEITTDVENSVTKNLKSDKDIDVIKCTPMHTTNEINSDPNNEVQAAVDELKLCSNIREDVATNEKTLKQNLVVMKDDNFSNEKCTEIVTQVENSVTINLESDKEVDAVNCTRASISESRLVHDSMLICDEDNNISVTVTTNNNLTDYSKQLCESNEVICNVKELQSKKECLNVEATLKSRSFKISIPKDKINVNDIDIPAADKILLTTYVDEENTLPEPISISNLHNKTDVVNRSKIDSSVNNNNKRHLKDSQNIKLKYRKLSTSTIDSDITNVNDNACYISLVKLSVDVDSPKYADKPNSDINRQDKVDEESKIKGIFESGCTLNKSAVEQITPCSKSTDGSDDTSEKVAVCSEEPPKKESKILPKRRGRKSRNMKRKIDFLENESTVTENSTPSKLVIQDFSEIDSKTKETRDIFDDQDSTNGSTTSFKRLISNICGSLESGETKQNVDKPQTKPIVNPDVFTKRLNIAETVTATVKILNSFQPISKTFYRSQKKIVFSNTNYDNVLIIQNLYDLHKSGSRKRKCTVNKTSLTGVTDSLNSFENENCEDSSSATKVINDKVSDMNVDDITCAEKSPNEDLMVVNSNDTVSDSNENTEKPTANFITDLINSKDTLEVTKADFLNKDKNSIVTDKSSKIDSINADCSCDLVSIDSMKLTSDGKNDDDISSHVQMFNITSESDTEDVPLNVVKKKIYDASLSNYDTTDSEFNFSDKMKCGTSDKGEVKVICNKLNFKNGNFENFKTTCFENVVSTSCSKSVFNISDREGGSDSVQIQDDTKDKQIISKLNVNKCETSPNTNFNESITGCSESNCDSLDKDNLLCDEYKTKELTSTLSIKCSDHDEDTSDSITTRLRNKNKVRSSVKSSCKSVSDNPNDQLRRRLRSSVFDSIKHDDKTENSLLLDMWSRISSTVNSARRTIGTHVTTVNNVLVGFEKIETIEQSPFKNCDSNVSVDDLIGMLQRVKKLQNN